MRSKVERAWFLILARAQNFSYFLECMSNCSRIHRDFQNQESETHNGLNYVTNETRACSAYCFHVGLSLSTPDQSFLLPGLYHKPDMASPVRR